MALALGLYGLALASLLPRLDALPLDTYNGFITVIGFDKLRNDAREVTDAAKAALAVCGTTPATCETASFPNVVNTMIQLDRMNAAFSSSLTEVSKVHVGIRFSLCFQAVFAFVLRVVTADRWSTTSTSESRQSLDQTWVLPSSLWRRPWRKCTPSTVVACRFRSFARSTRIRCCCTSAPRRSISGCWPTQII